MRALLVAAFLCLLTGVGVVIAFTAQGKARCNAEGAYYGAALELQNARREMGAGHGRWANAAASRGLEALGRGYDPGDVIDDTGLHLALAYGPEQAGDFQRAAEIRMKILEERMLLQRRHLGRLTCSIKL